MTTTLTSEHGPICPHCEKTNNQWAEDLGGEAECTHCDAEFEFTTSTTVIFYTRKESE